MDQPASKHSLVTGRRPIAPVPHIRIDLTILNRKSATFRRVASANVRGVSLHSRLAKSFLGVDLRVVPSRIPGRGALRVRVRQTKANVRAEAFPLRGLQP